MARYAPLYEDIAPGPRGGSAAWLETNDGTRIRAGHWPAAQKPSRGTVIIFPGRSEYIEKYAANAREITDAGFDVVAVDWRGQGLADRVEDVARLGNIITFSDYQRDVEAVLAFLHEEGLPEPFFLLGHSMGGAIGLRAILNGLPVEAVAFSAPMWGIALPPWLAPLAGMIASTGSAVGMKHTAVPQTSEACYVSITPFEGNDLTTDRETYEHMQHQLRTHPKLELGGPTYQWLKAALAECYALTQEPMPKVPALTFLGTDERIISPKAVRDTMARWEGGKLITLSGGRHEILMESTPMRRQVFDRLHGHFNETLDAS